MKIAPPQDDDLDDKYYELHNIYLHPDYIRQGIGTQAIQFAFDKALKMEKRFISVWVSAENKNAIKFYEKCGFIADNKTAINDHGRAVKSIRMIKALIL